MVQQFRDHRVVFTATSVVKEPTTPSYAARLDDERAWYRYVWAHGFTNVPAVRGWDPFQIERVDGVPLHHLTGLSSPARQSIFSSVLETVTRLQSLEDRPARASDVAEAYELAPAEAVRRVSQALGSGWPHPRTVNGQRVDDLTFPTVSSRAAAVAHRLRRPPRFAPVHGDLTLTNILWDRGKKRVMLLSPTGRFGSSSVFGDPLVDWAKLYFALEDRVDALLEGSFRLDRDANDAQVRLGATGWDGFTGPVRAAFLDRWEDLELLRPILWLLVAATLVHRPSQLEAAYLCSLEAFAKVDE